MDLIIRINLDNAAFEEDPEAALENIFEQAYLSLNLHNTIFQIHHDNLRDSNGNTVGTVEVTE